jgi:hypothetical protein
VQKNLGNSYGGRKTMKKIEQKALCFITALLDFEKKVHRKP